MSVMTQQEVETGEQLFTAADREQLRDSLRTLLERAWPGDKAISLRIDEAANTRLWSSLAQLGVLDIGGKDSAAGFREVVVMLEELGRFNCPAPLLDAVLTNVLLDGAKQASVANLLRELHAGRARVAFSLGALDPDRTAGSLTVVDGRVEGELRYVDLAPGATHLVSAVSAAEVVVLALSDPTLRVVPTRSYGAQGLATLHVENAKAEVLAVAASRLADCALLASLGRAARACGAASRSFELVVDYAKQRKQFGKFIGGFQAVQHKLVDNFIVLKGLTLSLSNAAAHYDIRHPAWKMFASSAIAHAGQSLRPVALETHHCFGAIGYAEEHEAPRHFKQVHQDVLRHGGPRVAREALARYFLDEGGSFPDYDLGEDANAFRAAVREWLASHWSEARQQELDDSDHPNRDFHAAFAREVGQTGWLAGNWPSRFGGQDRSPLEHFAYVEEMARVEAPRAGASIQAAAWMMFGTPEQLDRYLPELKRGEVMYGMWYSEPDSGSDLASIRTTAIRDGDEYVVNGQKIWTTTYWGDYMWLLAKTDPAAKPAHAGISLFCVPTKTEGVTIRPIETMYDGQFVNTFFDDMRIPSHCLVGELNGGWKVLTESLRTERGIVGAIIIARLVSSFQMVCDYLRQVVDATGRTLKDDPFVRHVIGDFAARIDAARQIALSCVLATGHGETAPADGAASKVVGSELMERFFEAVQEMVGMEAALCRTSEGSVLNGKLDQRLRHSLMWVISIGTNDIQRNMIAQYGLGLPRS